ncbi:MAG TPA: hypothetical protein VEB20_11730, partial [Azospirillaceae bacterium]|nr:hypothetical protein [Azospirillaceae bacterium]
FDGEGLFDFARGYAYPFIVLNVCVLALALLRPLRGAAAALAAGCLGVGALAAALLGIAMLPLTLLGMFLFGIGLLGLLPFATAIVLRRVARALWLGSGRRRGLAVVGMAMLLIFSAGFGLVEAEAIRRINADVLSTDPARREAAIERAAWLPWCTWICWEPIWRAWNNSPTDGERQAELAEAFRRLHGEGPETIVYWHLL